MLIVEDDPTLLRGLTDKFKQEGYDIRVACDGESAIDTAIEDPPDLILLDIMLPLTDGFEVCRTLREEAQLTMPILMLTARGQEGDVVRGLNAGADDYISKPFSIAELQARVKAALRRHQGTVSQRYTFGEFILDLNASSLLRAGQPVSLTQQELSLLAALAARPNRALTREMMLRAIRTRSSLTGIRSIDRCVKNLRAKIENDPKNPQHILTIREVGYRFHP